MYLDVICEWCYLAKHVLDTLQGEYSYEVEYRFMEIHPDIPEDGMPMSRHIRRPQRFYDDLDKLGNTYGVKFCRDKTFANTYYALVVLQYANEIGKLSQVLDPLWDAYMLRGKNISRIAEIVDITDHCGLSRADVTRAFADPSYSQHLESNYRLNHVEGGEGKVPFFRVDDKFMMHGAQDKETWKALFKILSQQQ
ncbi:MAG: DsbA family oxidoreductase [Atopobiaceae bacterium]